MMTQSAMVKRGQKQPETALSYFGEKIAVVMVQAFHIVRYNTI